MKTLLCIPLLYLAATALGQVTNPLLTQPAGGNRSTTTNSGAPAQQTINGKPVNSTSSGSSSGSMFANNINPSYTWTGLYLGASAELGIGKEKSERSYQGSPSTKSESTSLDYGLGLKGGYYVTPNIAIGTGFNLSGTRTKYPGNPDNDNDDYSTTDRDVSISPFVRFANGCSPWDCCRRFGYFVDFGVGIGSGRTTTKYEAEGSEDQVDKRSWVGAGFMPGIVYWPTERVGIEAGMGNFLHFKRERTKEGDEDGEGYNTESTNSSFKILDVTSLRPRIGIFYYFNNPSPKGPITNDPLNPVRF